MSFWYWFFGILGAILTLILILGFPRKKNERVPSLEGLDDPEVAKSFEKMASIFPFKILRGRVVSELKKLNPKGLLIDIGCGTGHLLVQIAKKFSLELVGIDVSSEVLEHAKNRVEVNGLEAKISLREGNAENLPFSTNSADFIVSTLSLHHWVNPTPVIYEIYRVLKENGTFLIFDFRRDARKFFYGLLTFVTKVVVPKPLKNINEPLGSLQAGYTPQEVLQFFSQHQLQKIEIKPYLAWMLIIGKK